MKRYLKQTLILCLALVFLCSMLTGCGNSGSSSDSSEPAQTEETEDTPEETAEPGQGPEIPGLTFESAMDKAYATEFDVYYYSDGYKLFHIDEEKDYLLVPEGKEAPEGLDESIVVLQAPIDHIYLAATAQMALFGSMDGYGSVRMTSLKEGGWTFDSIKEEMKAGNIIFAGKYSEPDYELLLDEDCHLAIESTMIYHSPEVLEMIQDLGIPVMVDRSSYEGNPLGRMEWIRFYGNLIGKEEEADAFFTKQKEKVEALNDFENTEKTVAFFYISSDGKAVVRSSKDYIPTMIEMAGARYIFKDLVEETGKSSIPMTIEKFYDVAADADMIIYNASIDGQVKTLEDLKAKDPIMSEFKAVKEGNCWSTGSSMYQRTDIVGDMIMDFHTLFTDEHPEDKLEYLSKLE